VLGQPGKLRIRTAAGEDLGIADGDDAPAFALERPRDDRRPAAPGAGADELVDELDEIVWKSNGDLPTDPVMLPLWDRVSLRGDCVCRVAEGPDADARRPSDSWRRSPSSVRRPRCSPTPNRPRPAKALVPRRARQTAPPSCCRCSPNAEAASARWPPAFQVKQPPRGGDDTRLRKHVASAALEQRFDTVEGRFDQGRVIVVMRLEGLGEPAEHVQGRRRGIRARLLSEGRIRGQRRPLLS
jgi:hypothetical protein